MASYFKPKKRWRARVRYRGLEVFIGYYKTEQEAVEAEHEFRKTRWKEQEEWQNARPTQKGLRGMWLVAKQAASTSRSTD